VAFAAAHLLALERTYELYQQAGRKLVVANFANVILGVVAPAARLLVCDISPCGGRCSFVVDTCGDLFPYSEFIGLAEFQGQPVHRWSGGCLCHGCVPCGHRAHRRDDRPIPTWRDPSLLRRAGPAEVQDSTAPWPNEAPFASCTRYWSATRCGSSPTGREYDFLWDNWDNATHTAFDAILP
jgi:uncharacterized protein